MGKIQGFFAFDFAQRQNDGFSWPLALSGEG
jgi:hypothetical protein